jgi:large subunit ribosomal protein L24
MLTNIRKHQKPGNNEPGGIIEKDMPLHVSNVAFYDPSLKKE